MADVAGFSHASVRIERAFTGEPSYAVACAVADDSLPAAHGCGGASRGVMSSPLCESEPFAPSWSYACCGRFHDSPPRGHHVWPDVSKSPATRAD